MIELTTLGESLVSLENNSYKAVVNTKYGMVDVYIMLRGETVSLQLAKERVEELQEVIAAVEEYLAQEQML
jgi:hypothetical protein